MERNDESRAGRETRGIFTLPSQTGILFVLLVLAVIVATVFDPLNPTTEHSIGYIVDEALDSSVLPDIGWYFSNLDSAIRWGFAALGLTLKFLLFPFVLVLTVLFLFVKPRRLRRAYKLQDLASKHPELAARFNVLAQQMGITKVPRLLWSPSQSREAFVFGAFGNHSVCLTEGIIRHFWDRPAELDAVMTHELGHVTNRDVTRTELAEAVVKGYFWAWLSIFAVQVMGFVVTAVMLDLENIAWDYSFLISFIYVAVFYLLMNALSRVRQSYADVRAVELERKEALDQAIGSLTVAYSMPAAGGLGVRRLAFSVAEAARANMSFLRRTLRLIGPEPGFWTRRAAIMEPGKLLQPRIAISFATGFILYRLCQALPLADYFQAAIASSAILVLLALTLVPHFLQKTFETRRAAFFGAVRAVLPQAVACALGTFTAGMLVLYTQRLANSTTLLPTSLLESWTEMMGQEPLSFSLVGSDALHQSMETLWFFIGLASVLTLLLWTVQSRRMGYSLPRVAWSRLRFFAAPRLWAATIALALFAVYSFPAVSMAAGAFHQGIASSYGDRGDLGSAMAECSRAVELNPASASAWFMLGNYQSYQYLRRWDAVESHTRAIELNPRYVAAYCNRGSAYCFLGEYQQAIADYTTAIELNPDYVDAYCNRGTAYSELGEYQQAIADYTRAIEIDLNEALAYCNRGSAYYFLGKYQQAIADYTRAIEIDLNLAFFAYSGRGNAYYELGEYQQAIADYTTAIKLNPVYVDAYSGRGNTYYDLGQYQQAIADYTTAIEIDPNEAPAYFNRGHTYYELGQFQQAIADYTKAIEIDPNLAEAYYSRGNTYYELGEYQQAIADYTRAIEIDPNLAEAYYSRGNAYYELGEYQQAIADYTKAIEINPNLAVACCSRGNAYYELGEYQQAIADYTRAIEIDPNEAGNYYNRGRTYTYLGEHQQAIINYSRAIELKPNYADAYISRGITHLMLGKYEQSIEDLSIFIGIRPDNADGYELRGHSYYELGHYQQAIADYHRALHFGARDASAIYARIGWTYYLMGEYGISILASSAALETDPTQATIRYNLGLALLAAGRYEEAISEYAKAVETTASESDIDAAIDDIAQLIAEQPQLEEAASKIIQRLQAARVERFG